MTSSIPATAETDSRLLQQFLRFQLTFDTTALLPVKQMVEVLSVPISQVVPIPHLPNWVMGVYNWRGDILWMVDLGQLLGFTPLHEQASTLSTFTVIVIRDSQQGQGLGRQQAGSHISSGKILGLVVKRVEDMESCNPDLIQPASPSTVSSELLPFLDGYWLKPHDRMLVVLNGNSILAKMPQPEASAS